MKKSILILINTGVSIKYILLIFATTLLFSCNKEKCKCELTVYNEYPQNPLIKPYTYTAVTNEDCDPKINAGMRNENRPDYIQGKRI